MKKLSTHTKTTIGIVALGIATSLCFIGTTAGTLAWYAYSRTTRVSYVGTSVAKSALLGVGIVDDNHYITQSKLDEYELTREDVDGHSIVFTNSTNGLDHRAIRDYLFNTNKYAVSMLFPVSTQDRSLSDVIDPTDPDAELPLFRSPEYGDTQLLDPAETMDYVRIPFAFRIDKKNDDEVIRKDVWLTDVSVKADGENIDQAVRVFIEDKNKDNLTQRSFLMRPADKSTSTGSTKVGGLLDLDGDGTYDYDRLGHEEYFYGKFNGTLENELDEYGIPQELAEYDDVNGVYPPGTPEEDKEESTFYAKHNEEAKLVKLSQLSPQVAEYETFGTVKPGFNGDGDYYENTTTGIGKRITTMRGNAGIGYATFTIFIEGWDHAVVDKAAGYSFNLGLKFEVNKI